MKRGLLSLQTMTLMKIRICLILSVVYSGTLHVSSKCTNSEMCVYFNASLENTQNQSVSHESLFPKSCAASCADRTWCLGVTDDKRTKMCIYHSVDKEGRGPSFISLEMGLTLYLKKKYDGICVSVSV